MPRSQTTKTIAKRIDLEYFKSAGALLRTKRVLTVLAVLLALLDECPVLHAALGALSYSLTLPVSASDFEFISENSQIASVREFMQSLPEILRG